jgi:hypothetical protein
MAIQLNSESLLSLSEAAASLPGRPHLSTLHRWRLRGVRGIRLETCLVGGARYTSREALQRFVESTTKEGESRAGPCKSMPRTARVINVRTAAGIRQRAKRILDEAGI